MSNHCHTLVYDSNSLVRESCQTTSMDSIPSLIYESQFRNSEPIESPMAIDSDIPVIPISSESPESPTNEFHHDQVVNEEPVSFTGSTYFSKPDVQYSTLTENDDIEMAAFLKACRGIVEFVGFLGTAFSPVKHDISGNIDKVEHVYLTNTRKYGTIKKLLDAEIIDWPDRMGPATVALLWLKRALEFICIFLELLVTDHISGKKSSTLAPIGKEAYQRTLRNHHGIAERLLFKVIIHATPWRKDFLKTVAGGRDHAEDECIADISRYLNHMKPNVDRLVLFYKDYGFEK